MGPRIQIFVRVGVMFWLLAGTVQAGVLPPDFPDDAVNPVVSRSRISAREESDCDDDHPDGHQQLLSVETVLKFVSTVQSNILTSGMSPDGQGWDLSHNSGLAASKMTDLQPPCMSRYHVRVADFALGDAFLERVFRPPRCCLS
jgi:hypothetical protein